MLCIAYTTLGWWFMRLHINSCSVCVWLTVVGVAACEQLPECDAKAVHVRRLADVATQEGLGAHVAAV